MTILIIGGLLVLAVLAIIGAVLLGMSEDRAEKVRKSSAAPAPASLPQPLHTRKLADASEVTLPVTPAPVLAPMYPTGQLPFPQKSETLASLDGQVREITSELRVLALRAGELEKRLNSLIESLEHHPAQQATVSGHTYMPEPEAQPLQMQS